MASLHCRTRAGISLSSILVLISMPLPLALPEKRTLPPKAVASKPIATTKRTQGEQRKKKTAPKQKQAKPNQGKPALSLSLPVHSPQFVRARQTGMRLLERYKKGALTLLNPQREEPQIRAIAKQGYYMPPDGKPIVFAPLALQTLDRLTARATRAKPLALMSLYRPPRRPGSREPHANGLAIDIAAYDGKTIHSRNPKQTEAGVIAVIKALGRGEYALGLPKPPDTDPIAFLPPPARPKNWPFFPAPLPATFRLPGLELVAPRPQQPPFSSPQRIPPSPFILRWENERGAPLEDIGSQPVRAALRAAEKRKTRFIALFPDALDHLHLHVRPFAPR